MKYDNKEIQQNENKHQKEKKKNDRIFAFDIAKMITQIII